MVQGAQGVPVLPISTSRAEAAVQVHDDVLVLARARIRLRVGRGNARGGSKVQPELQLDALELATARVKIDHYCEGNTCVREWMRARMGAQAKQQQQQQVRRGRGGGASMRGLGREPPARARMK